jgi:hypothetical protein
MIETAHLSDAKRALLARYLRGKEAQSSDTAVEIPRRSPADAVPLSLYQEDLWLKVQTASEAPPFFNESITIHRRGPLDVEILERSLVEIVRRHEAWRTTIDVSQGRPLQVIGPAPQKISLPVVDLRELPVEMREAAALKAGEEQGRAPFNLKEGPLVRTKLVRLCDESYRLFFTMHQIVVDGVSVYNVLPCELASIYEAFSQGNPLPLPDLPVQYGDFAIWHRQRIRAKVENQLTHWRKQLSGGLPVLRWGDDVTRPSLQSYRGAIQPVTFTRVLTQGLKELGEQEGITMFMVLLAAFNVLLRHYTGQDQITVGTLAPSGRKHTDVQRLLGYFLNPVALHTDLSGDITFRELLWRVRQVTSEALSNDDIPMEWVLRELTPSWDRLSSARLRVMISLAPTMSEIQPGWNMTPMDVNSGGSRWDLYLELADTSGGLIGRAQYNPDIFNESTIVKMLEDLQSVLEDAIRDPGQRLSELGPSDSPRLSAAELYTSDVR